MDQVTAVESPGLVPVTEAVNDAEAPTMTFALFGLTETATEDWTVTVAWARFEESALLVATTWKVPLVWGAVYRPEESTVPPFGSSMDQLKPAAWRELSPEMEAWKSTSPPREVVAAAGTTETEMPEVSAATCPTSPLHPWARTAVRIRTRRPIRRRTHRKCARSLAALK
jgi:hypothetical protein